MQSIWKIINHNLQQYFICFCNTDIVIMVHFQYIVQTWLRYCFSIRVVRLGTDLPQEHRKSFGWKGKHLQEPRSPMNQWSPMSLIQASDEYQNLDDWVYTRLCSVHVNIYCGTNVQTVKSCDCSSLCLLYICLLLSRKGQSGAAESLNRSYCYYCNRSICYYIMCGTVYHSAQFI